MDNLVASKNEVAKMNESTKSTIANIKNLQDLEKNLYSSLENSASSASPPSLAEQEQSITRINELSNMRATLFGNLKNMYSMNQYQVAQTRNDLVDELTTVKVIEGELNNSKKQMNALKQAKQNKLRMVEINTYYGKRYEAHANLMKIIIITCIPILIITVLSKKGILPQNVSNMVVAGIIVIFIVVMWYRVSDIIFRDNMDYDQYDYPFDPNSVDLGGDGTSNVIALPSPLSLGIECVGDSCCTGDNMIYDHDKNTCIVQKSSTNDTAIMTKEAFSSWDGGINLKGGVNVQPYDGEHSFVKV